MFIIFVFIQLINKMSPRPKNIRKVDNLPVVSGFKPIGVRKGNSLAVSLHFEEYEAIKLCDYDLLTQQEACRSMGVSRPTFSRIYTQARQKIARALVQGLPLLMEGGTAFTNSEWYRCDACGVYFNTIRPVVTDGKPSCPMCASTATTITDTILLEKEKTMKKIAIPTRNNVVDNHFGHCEFYTILTVGQDNRILTSETIPSPQGCGCKSNIAGQLEQMGVSVMLAGNMGQGALNVLTNHHIQVIRGCSGPVLEVAEAYLSGQLADSGVGCAGHGDEHHQCSHHHE